MNVILDIKHKYYLLKIYINVFFYYIYIYYIRLN